MITQSRNHPGYRLTVLFILLAAIGGISFVAGMAWSIGVAHADEPLPPPAAGPAKDATGKMVYPKKTELDFDGMGIEGQVKSPGEFYFQHRNEEKFDSLVKRRKDFHREMLRDAVLSR